ncbi:uncharacterized protein LOC119173473 [Rhipicephalus microplus]|uniref:uncharacterized protein LOC119173473 n=1 Tax=Rhipicephalus microplus TaxID=6941 RepID=UPI003F6C863D
MVNLVFINAIRSRPEESLVAAPLCCVAVTPVLDTDRCFTPNYVRVLDPPSVRRGQLDTTASTSPRTWLRTTCCANESLGFFFFRISSTPFRVFSTNAPRLQFSAKPLPLQTPRTWVLAHMCATPSIHLDTAPRQTVPRTGLDVEQAPGTCAVKLT